MSKTLDNLRTGVREILDESAQTDFLDSEVDREINYAYHDVAGEVMEIYEDFYFTTTPVPITTVAGTQEYSLSSSLIKVRRVEINYAPSNANSKPVRAIAIEIDELPTYLANTSLGGAGIFNSGYYIIGDIGSQKIGFVPIPQDGAAAACSVWGISLPSDLSSASDNVNIPWADRFAKAIELKAGSYLLRKGQQELGAAEDLEKQYQIEIVKMKTFLKDRTSDGMNIIQDLALEDTQFDTSLY